MRNQVATIENISSFDQGIVIPFTVLGQENSKLMEMLSAKVYKDAAAAVIREYTTNALDSHLASHQSRPVEITSPNRLYPFFVVQDFGVGLDLEDMKNIYTQYIVSTKEDNDEETGNLGIGSKAGLGFVGQYTVASVKNGQKIVGIVTRNDLGNPIMICELSETDEENGVKITIPVNYSYQHEYDTFCNKIKHFHQFLKPGLLLVDGQEADRSKFQSIAPNMEIHYGFDQDYVVMGSVAYPVDRNLFPKLYNRSIITYVEMGEVQFTQSREEMNYTVLTKTSLAKYREQFKENIHEYMKDAIEACDNKREAYNLQYEFLWNSDLRVNGSFSYRGAELPDNFSARRPGGVTFSRYRWGMSGDQYCQRLVEASSLVQIEPDILYVTNWTNTRFTRVQADKIDKYCADNNIVLPLGNKRATFLNEIDPELLTGCTVVSWEDVKKVKLPGRSSTTKKAKHYYGAYDGGQYDEYVPDANKPLWYGVRTEMTSTRYPDYVRLLSPWNQPGQQFVFVTQTYMEKFLKEFPHAKHYRVLYQEQYMQYLNSLTDKDYEILANSGRVNCGTMLVAELVDDPELRAAAEFTQNLMSEKDKAVLRAHENSQKILQRCGWQWTHDIEKTHKIPKSAGTKHELHKKYPLLERIYHTSDMKTRRHLTDYVNWVHNNQGE